MKFNNRQTNGKIIYRIDDHWSDESLQRKNKISILNLISFFTVIPFVA